MSSQKDSDNPATTSAAWEAMAPKWQMVSSLLGGTSAMREAGQVFLPIHDEETDHNYAERLGKAVLFNMTELTLDSWVGRPFSSPVVLNDDVPEKIVTLSDDIDLEGNNITVFCRSWFRESLGKAFAHVLIDLPVLTEEDKEGRTLEDDNVEGRRPYWILIKPENVISAFSEVINGREVLTHVRIRETFIERDGFAEVVKNRIRILEPGFFQLLEESDKKVAGKAKWDIIEEGETGLSFIPMVTFYADREKFMVGKPPVEDLAFLNVRHWQAKADLINVLTVAQFPMLAVAGATDTTGTTLAIGPKQLLGTKDPNGRFYYVEHSGKAIASGRQELVDLVEEMASYGAEFLKKRPGRETATARALDSAESTSPLQDTTVRFMDSVNIALDMTATWLDIRDGGGTVTIETDFGPENVETDDFKTLNIARKDRDLSQQKYIDELMRRGLLPDEFDNKENIEQLRLEFNDDETQEDDVSKDEESEN